MAQKLMASRWNLNQLLPRSGHTNQGRIGGNEEINGVMNFFQDYSSEE